MTLEEHCRTVQAVEAQMEQEAFDRLAAENGLPKPAKGEYGSAYLTARYWFALGYEAMRERGRE